MQRMLMMMAMMVGLGLGAGAAVVDRTEVYQHGETTLEGYVAYDEDAARQGRLPVVLIVHQWMGLGDYEKARARMLAELGYLAFAVDIYGQGTRAENREQARELATKYRSDRALMRGRAQAAVAHARTLPWANPTQIGAIGYCFGGGVVLELARSGADVAGVVSFHGNLDTPDPADNANIRASILVCHGAADTGVPMEQVVDFVKQMAEVKVDWYLEIYADAVHGFTHFTDEERYDAMADRRSWQEMQAFFSQLFGT